MSPLFYVVVCTAILNHKNQILVGKRKTEPLPGYWEFPGGKLENDEDLIEGLKREIREELNLEIENEKLLAAKPVRYKENQILVLFYLSQLKSGEASARVHDEILWCTLQELKQINLLPANQELVLALDENLLFKG